MAKAGLQFSKKDEWYTPKEVVDFFGPFDYDPCTTKERAKYFGIPNYDTIDTDGLETDWTKYKKIWVNPPFTRKFEFLLKATQSLEEMNGDAEIYFLMPIDSLTTKIFNEVISGTNYELIIPNGRIKFEDANGGGQFTGFWLSYIKTRLHGQLCPALEALWKRRLTYQTHLSS